MIDFDIPIHIARSREMDGVRQFTPAASATTSHKNPIQNFN